MRKKNTTIRDVISTTEVGETVVLIETKRIEYIRVKGGLRVLATEDLKTKREFNNRHRRYRQECFPQ